MRLVSQPVEKHCTPDQKEECFLNGILSNPPFDCLPKHFLKIGDDRTSKNLYYTIQSGSKLTITLEKLQDAKLETPETDICIQFKYFVSPAAKLLLRFNNEIDLVTIDGTKLIPKAGIEISDIDLIGGELTKDPVEVCLKALLPIHKFIKDMTSFKLNFESRTDNHDETVAVELVNLNSFIHSFLNNYFFFIDQSQQ